MNLWQIHQSLLPVTRVDAANLNIRVLRQLEVSSKTTGATNRVQGKG